MHEGISRAAALTQTYHTFRISLYNNHACGSAIHKHHSFLASNKITIIHMLFILSPINFQKIYCLRRANLSAT